MRIAFSAFFQREEVGEAARAVAGPIDGWEVAESGIKRTIDGSRGLQGAWFREIFLAIAR